MSNLPLELSDEARVWCHRTLQQLTNCREQPSSFLPGFPDPDDPLWAAPVAKELAENWTSVTANADKHYAAALDRLIHRIAQWLRSSLKPLGPNSDQLTSDEVAFRKLLAVQAATELFVQVRGSPWGQSDGALLQVAFASGHPKAIQMGIDFLLQSPPQAWTSASLALSPLLQYNDWCMDWIFPRILESSNPSILATALDIANHLVIHNRVAVHPCHARYDELVALLGGVVQRLGVLEENPSKFGDSTKEVQAILFDSVSLCVSLCHTMSLLGNQTCIGKLMQAAELRHRRLRTEAAFALAKLGHERGKELLIELAADPSARTRALAYAEELGCGERIDDQYKTILAQSEAQLAQWLALVEQMGVPPTRIELLEQRTLPWPGFEGPQECFLFRFGYDMPDTEFSNVGIAGPTVKAFSQDLANVSIDDAFAMFAGWDIEHPEAYELPAERLPAAVQSLVQDWIDHSLSQQFESIEQVFVGHFFGQEVLAGYGLREGKSQPFAFDGQELVVCPALKSNHDSLLLTYYLWRGRSFFRTFG